MFDKLDLECIKQIDTSDITNIKIFASSYLKNFKIVFKGVLNFSFSIDFDKTLEENDLDIVGIEYKYDYLKKDMFNLYSYRTNKNLSSNKLHYLFVYGDLELVVISRELSIEEI